MHLCIHVVVLLQMCVTLRPSTLKAILLVTFALSTPPQMLGSVLMYGQEALDLRPFALLVVRHLAVAAFVG